MDRDLPEGVVDADPPGGWSGVADGETDAQNADAQDSPALVANDEEAQAHGSTDAALQPDDPVEGEAARQGADPDLGIDRGEEP